MNAPHFHSSPTRPPYNPDVDGHSPPNPDLQVSTAAVILSISLPGPAASNTGSSSSYPIDTVLSLPTLGSATVAQIGASTLDPELVDRLTQHIDAQVPTPSSMFTSEKNQFIRQLVETGLRLCPPSPDVKGKAEDDLLSNSANGLSQRLWSLVASSFERPPTDPDEIRFFNQIQQILSNSSLDPQSDVASVIKQLMQDIPKDVVERLIPEKVTAHNLTHGTQFTTLKEVANHCRRLSLRLLADKMAQSPHRHSAEFLGSALLIMGRTCNFRSFADCVTEDVLASRTAENSSVLWLLDNFIIDFIQAERKSIWFQSIEDNFGYRRTEESWDHFIGEQTFERLAVETHMSMFEHALDIFHKTEENTLSAPEAVLEIVGHLDWILSVPFDVIYAKISSAEPETTGRYTRDHQIFQEAFVRWAIDEVKRTHPELVDNRLLMELRLRLRMAAHILPDAISESATLTKNLALAQAVKPLIESGVVAAQHAARNLIASRSPDGPKQDLVLGFGFQGKRFSDQPNAKYQPDSILLNVSERGRRVPEPTRMEQSLFSIPFLYATQYLMQKINQEITGQHLAKEKIPITVLGQPTEEDKKIHRYLFDRLITHAFTNPAVQLNPHFLDAGARAEIQRTVTTYFAGTIPAQKGLKPADRLAAQQRVRAIAAEIGRKITEMPHPQLSPEELQLLLEALSNRSSICVESVISRHGKNNLIVPVSFDPRRHDIISLSGKEVRVGSRGIIPPCDRYCQLFAGSHLLWADLTRNPSMDQLDQTAKESGARGLAPPSSRDNSASSSSGSL